jgi:hypothetical protein
VRMTLAELQLLLEGTELVGRYPLSPPPYVLGQEPSWLTTRGDIRSESNVALLEEVALLLERENDRLVERVEKLTEELVRLEGGNAEAVQMELESLRQLLELGNQALFGHSCEKAPKSSDGLPRAKEPHKGHGPTEQLSVPVKDVVLSLDEPDMS